MKFSWPSVPSTFPPFPSLFLVSFYFKTMYMFMCVKTGMHVHVHSTCGDNEDGVSDTFCLLFDTGSLIGLEFCPIGQDSRCARF